MRKEYDILETELSDEEIEELANSIEDVHKTNYEDSIADLLGELGLDISGGDY